MKTPITLLAAVALAAAFLSANSFAQTSASSPAASTTAPASASGMPSEAEMMKQMMDMAKLNDNHRLLAELVGTWTFTNKMWMNPDPKAPPTESKGVAVRKAVMDGRFFTSETTGKMPMPGLDGKMKDVDFKGMSVEGYDNVKKKFVSLWADNMGTGFMMSEGTYDPSSKTFTYTGSYEMMPGMTLHVREVIKVVDKDHHIFEYYDDSRGAEAKSMEISYTRQK